MKKCMAFSKRILGAGLLALFATPLFAATSESETSLRNIQDAVEAVSVDLIAGSGGDVVAVRAKACDACTVQSFLPGPDMTFSLDQKEIGRQAALNASGKRGVVLYDVQSHLVDEVVFFSR